MKKIFAIVLTLAMVLAMSTTAFAATTETLTDETLTGDAEILAKVNTDTKNIAVISVDVTYGDLKFMYVDTDSNVWDPETHTYSADGNGEWLVDGDNTVTVTNHSNRKVSVEVNAELETSVTNVTAAFDVTDPVELAAGEVNKPDEAANKIWTLTISSTEPATDPTGISTADYAKIGTVTVTIEPVDDATNG